MYTAALLVLLHVVTTRQNDDIYLWKGNIGSFRELYERVPQNKLSALPHAFFYDNPGAEACAERCVKEQVYLCKSFDVDNIRRACYLYIVDHEDIDVRLVPDTSVDHYQSAYARLFDPTPGHRLHTWMNSEAGGVSVEQCARMCVLETGFKCESFNYDPRLHVCRLTEYSEGEGYGLTVDPTIDFYRRKPESALKNFINFGQSSLKTLSGINIYDDTTRGDTLDECAQACMQQTSFHCASFDYIHEGDYSLCHMSQYIAANVHGLMDSPIQRVNHYERIEQELRYFYATPYSVLLGNDVKTYSLVTPARCARMCLQEEGFVCRSFDYSVEEGKCLLSDKTGSDVGGLYYNPDLEIHHFEMKPILDCGANLTGPSGDLASPGWPRNYSHHERCTWNITVPENKIINIRFTHLDIGTAADEACGESHDRLVVREQGAQSCIKPRTLSYSTTSNQALLTFFSNHERDAQGFRAFYTADWTCDARLTTAPGDFASPHWPDDYPTSMLCSWRIHAPDGFRIKLYFTSFQLETHALKHCNDHIDHVIVLDGGSVDSQRIGMYCGAQVPFDILSTDTDLFVQFFSDADRTQSGFHATFVFEPAVTSPADHKPLVPPDSGVIDLDQDGGDKHEGDEEEDESHSKEQLDTSDKGVVISGDKEYQQDLPPRTAADQRYSELSREYKSAVWAVITLLIILLCAVSVVLFLVWRHYKRKLQHVTELVQEEPLLSHDHPITVTYQVKPNNITMGNEVDLSAQGACGGATDMTPYAKYKEENIKNVNLDTKCESMNEKSNLGATSGGAASSDCNRYV